MPAQGKALQCHHPLESHDHKTELRNFCVLKENQNVWIQNPLRHLIMQLLKVAGFAYPEKHD